MPADQLRDQLQTTLGNAYTLDRELGGGGMSRVFVAREEALGRDVVVKVLSPELAAELSAERFAREIRLAAALQEPHIVPVLTAGMSADGLPYYTMPFVRGESLRARLERGRLDVAESVGILRDVAKALVYAHAQGVVHRDIKPENVLLQEGTAVVTDFGIAKAVSASKTQAPGGTLTVVGTSIGTPAYMAPEQAVGDPVDHRADIYAWGVMAYELLAGRHPFAGKTSAQQLIAAHIAETPAPLTKVEPDVPPLLSTLIAQTLAKLPSERPASATELIQVLDDRHLLDPPPADALHRDAGDTRRLGRRRLVLRACVVVAAVLLTAGAAWRVVRRASSAALTDRPSGAADISTVAVLPFVNIGGDPKDEYFSDGMTDELAHALSTLPGMRLAGRTSSYAFKGKNAPAAEIGRALDVAGLVEGTVQRDGNRLRVTAQLTSAVDGKVRWGDRYERANGDVFAVQDELTKAIVGALAPALRGGRAASIAGQERGTPNAEAYDLYLRGRYFWAKRGGDNLVRAAAYFRQAIAKDSGFARAYAGLAMTYGVMPFYAADAADTLPARAMANARQALALDSTLADAHNAMSNAFAVNGRPAEAEAEHARALELLPQDATTHQWHGDNLLVLGRVDESIAEMRKAIALDPLSPVVRADLDIALFDARRFDEAIASAQRAVELGAVFGLHGEALAYLFAGRPDSALVLAERAMRVDPGNPAGRAQLALAYAANGRWDDVERMRIEIGRNPSSDPSGLDAALIALAMGDHAPLLHVLQTPAGRKEWGFRYYSLGCSPLLDPLANEPAYRAMLAQQHLGRCEGTSPWPIRQRRR